MEQEYNHGDQAEGHDTHGEDDYEAMDVDIEELFSDEDENDDLIDDEAELQELLRQQNVTMDLPLPAPSPSAQDVGVVMEGNVPTNATAILENMAFQFSQTTNRPASTYFTSLNMGSKDPVMSSDAHVAAPMISTSLSGISLPPLSSQPISHTALNAHQARWPNTPPIAQESTQLLQGSQSTSVYQTANSGVPTEPSVVQLLHRALLTASTNTSSGARRQDRIDSSSTGTTPGPDRRVEFRLDEENEMELGEDEEANEHWIRISHEDNVKVTFEIRENTKKALEVNREYQEVLQRQLRQIELARQRNRRIQAQLKEIIDSQNRVKQAPVIVSSGKLQGAFPYFVDHKNETPPHNQDTINSLKLTAGFSTKIKHWNEKERENLKSGVISENKRLLYTTFTLARDIMGLKALETATDTEMMLNTKGLDWKRISRMFVDTRTASECLIQWTGHDHPGINKKAWSKEETIKLDELVKKYDQRNWIQVALDLNSNRTGAQCFRHYMSRQSKTTTKGMWTEEENNILREAVDLLGTNSWQQVAYCLDNRTAAQCATHWLKVLDPRIRRGRWLEEEDGALRAAIQVYGTGKWTKVQQHVLGRTDVQCRERYMNILAPDVKTGPWSKEEDERLMELERQFGGKKWSKIASMMDGRTDNQCWRRFMMLARDQMLLEGGEMPYIYDRMKRRKGVTTIAGESDHGRVSEWTTQDRKRYLQTSGRERDISESHTRKRERRRKGLQHRLEERIRSFEQKRREVITNQEEELRKEYDRFTKSERRIYDAWMVQWGRHVDPIEKVFNLGIPPTTETASSSRGLGRGTSETTTGFTESARSSTRNDLGVQGRVDENAESDTDRTNTINDPAAGTSDEPEAHIRHEWSITSPNVPSSAEALLPGRIRPAPPCYASMNAFDNLLIQGQAYDNRFQLKHTIKRGSILNPSKTEVLSAEARNRPEYVELAERFEATFMWPMLMGMLDMNDARELVRLPSQPQDNRAELIAAERAARKAEKEATKAAKEARKEASRQALEARREARRYEQELKQADQEAKKAKKAERAKGSKGGGDLLKTTRKGSVPDPGSKDPATRQASLPGESSKSVSSSTRRKSRND